MAIKAITAGGQISHFNMHRPPLDFFFQVPQTRDPVFEASCSGPCIGGPEIYSIKRPVTGSHLNCQKIFRRAKFTMKAHQQSQDCQT